MNKLTQTILLGSLTLGAISPITTQASKNKKPNFVIIYTDDLGYGDLSCYGNPTIRTPHLDQMASEGIKFTQFYVAAPVCTPSRAALMTGSYPKRVGLHEHVLFPRSKKGLNPKEQTIATLLKEQGYTTGCVGKWHLGHQKKFLPVSHGFDMFFGMPFSNDMSRKEQYLLGSKKDYGYSLPVISQADTLELDPDQSYLTKRLTEKSVEFIHQNKKEPFFLYFAQPMPHIPIYASDDFQGKSKRGKYGDTIEEIDWSVGQILQALKDAKVAENTLVLFSSDNGPWKVYKTEGGSAGPLRGAKGTTWEGGMREPFIAWWPGTIKPQQLCTEVVTNMDILPTFCKLANAQLPKEKIDGQDISDLFFNPRKTLEERPFYYYTKQGKISAVRKGAWKLILQKEGAELYNIEEDISEDYNLAKKHPEKVKQLKTMLEKFDQQMDKEKRQAGLVETK
ncbi:arylsulfatase [Puteibacter caeruleilacunae]|nr:arylsulfatase [Puteibacter caeruleilacunae]